MKDMIKRTLFDQLLKHLKTKEMFLLAGPRQAGKTYLLTQLKDHLIKQGKAVAWFNLDIETDRQFFVSQSALVEQIKLTLGNKPGFVFIDEIQRKENAGLFLKGLYDMNLPYKFIISGSGSLELKEKIHETSTGRKFIFELNTLSFMEFVHHRTNYLYEGKPEHFFQTDKITAENLLNEYLNFGGYPRVVLAQTLAEKTLVINEIWQSYLERDIAYLIGLKKTEEFIHLVKVLASQIGQMINVHELSDTLNLAVQTVNLYLWYLEKTYILQRLAPFSRNLRKEITKMPVAYFFDLGLRNFSANEFGGLAETGRRGFVFQNLVLRLIKEQIDKSSSGINFWRTQDKAEVDFVVSAGQNPLPVEVKYKHLVKPEIPRSLKSFIKKYQPKEALMINLDLETETVFQKTKVRFLPYWRLLASFKLFA